MNSKKVKFVCLIVFLFIIDRISKFIAINHLYQDGLFVLNKFFGLKFYKNCGLAFGLNLNFYLIIILNIAIAFLFILFFRKKVENNLIFALILSGILGNLMDRIFLGYAVDFIVISPFWIVNLADIFILIGLVGVYFSCYNKNVLSYKNQK